MKYRDKSLCTAVVFAMLSCHGLSAQEASKKQPVGPLPPVEKASWIWQATDVDVCEIRTTFTLDEVPSAASILITADNGYELYVNGALAGFDVGAGSEIWNSLERYDIKSRLAQGKNVIGVRSICLGGGRGLVAAARIDMPDRPPLEILTDASWRVTVKGDPEEYSHPEFLEDEHWAAARVLGTMGMAPWGKLTYAGSKGGRRHGALPVSIALNDPDPEFRWPNAVAFVGDDCSVYVPLRGDAWGVCFRVNNWSRAYTEFDIPCPSKIGRKLYALKPMGPDAKPRLLVDAGSGAIGSPSVTYDGKSVYVAMAADGESFFHIYRVPADGGSPERLTDGPFHDIDPAELPDGRIVFTSTRAGSFEEYHNPPSRALFAMKPDGSDIEPITFTPTFDNEPKVMSDGRIAFIRTDNFFDRAKVETQIHIIRPDGTDGLTELGADVGADYGVRLRALGYGSPAPLPGGKLACISSRGNFIATPGAPEASFHKLPSGLGDLASLPDGRLLATVLRPDVTRMVSDVLAVIDPSDNQVVAVYESPDGSIHSPVFLGPRPRPPILADTLDRERTGSNDATGFLYCQDVRFTRKYKADWDQIRAIRVLGAKALTTRSSHSHIVHAGHETVELGTVPIAPDGSFYVEVPADLPLALQAIDAEGRSELNEMSWIYVRPGETRSCLGCHHARRATPPGEFGLSDAMRARPLKLLGQGQPHHFRGNNSGVTGMMDLQFERFRETASMNLHTNCAGPRTTGKQEVVALIEQLGGDDDALQISAAQRLALLRDRSAAAELAKALEDRSREVRVAAALALAACGTRESIPPLLEALTDRYQVAAQAAAVAVENLTGTHFKTPLPLRGEVGRGVKTMDKDPHPGPLPEGEGASDTRTGHARPFQPFVSTAERQSQADAWQAWFQENDWGTIEESLIERISAEDRATQRRAIVALGHIGGDAARAALRDYVTNEKDKNPYPPFEKNNRTDRFTFPADSPLNPRTLQEAVRAIGYLKDTSAVGLLRDILANHIDPKTGNLFLAEAAIDALGRIATPEAETLLIDTFAELRDYIHYVGWYSDHPALYACHASPLHARIIAALDRIGSTRAGAIVPHLIRSVPTDPDRALFPESDTYETLVGRVILRSGRGDQLIETCLALLGDQQTKPVEDLKRAVSTTFGAWAGTPAPDNRAAHMLSLACRDQKYESRVRAAYERYRAKPEDEIKRPLGNPSWIPQRHWVLFYLGRTLGNLGDPRSADTLLTSLAPELNEARHGRPDPAEPNIHFLQLEYTPCWRAAAAWALGQIGDPGAVPVLLDVIRNLDNATDTRHAAAEALGNIADPASLEAIQQLAEGYPEVSTRRALIEACENLSPR